MITAIQELDQQLFLYLNALGSSHWDWLWIFITSKWSWLPLYILLFYSLVKKTGWKIAFYTLIAIALLITISDQTSNILKHGLGRLRPCHLDFDLRILAPCGRYGFPSAHAFSSMALALFVGNLLKPYYKYALPFLFTWSVFVGYSRVYVGVHYPGDITVGFIFGSSLGYLFYRVFKNKIQHQLQSGNFSIYKPSPTVIEEFKNRDTCFLCRRNYLPIGFLVIIAIILYLRSELAPGAFFLENTSYEIYYEMVAVILSLTGACIRILVIGYPSHYPLQRFPEKTKTTYALNTSGIYSLVRHPLYIGNFLLWLGLAIWTGNYWFISAFCLVYWGYYEWIIHSKENAFSHRFGDEYREWMARTPAFLPKFKNYQKPNAAFQWKRVLKRERNALFILFFTFCLLNIIGELLEQETHYNYFLILMTFVTGIGCLVLYYLDKKNLLLREKIKK